MTADATPNLWVPNAMVFGSGLGLSIGLSLSGPAFIAPGLLVGAGVGLVVGAAIAAQRSAIPQ